MKVIKLFQLKEYKSSKGESVKKFDPDNPEYYHLVRSDMFRGGYAILVNYPIDKPNSKRLSKWLYTDEVQVEWVKTFNFEGLTLTTERVTK
jgi:hypothetical protein